jgi:histidine phosphotransferase ChpT
MNIEPTLHDAAADLTALLGSRICHDLISPLGAISNGVELLLMSGVLPGPEITLIAESIAAANARIRCFRVAFGAGAGQSMAPSEILSILQDMTRGGRLQITWAVTGPAARRDAKLAFLGLLCAESAMPWGGRITVAADKQDWTIIAEADRLTIDNAMWGRINGTLTAQAPTAAQVQFALFADEARRQGRMTRLSLGDQRISFTF